MIEFYLSVCCLFRSSEMIDYGDLKGMYLHKIPMIYNEIHTFSCVCLTVALSILHRFLTAIESIIIICPNSKLNTPLLPNTRQSIEIVCFR